MVKIAAVLWHFFPHLLLKSGLKSGLKLWKQKPWSANEISLQTFSLSRKHFPESFQCVSERDSLIAEGGKTSFSSFASNYIYWTFFPRSPSLVTWRRKKSITTSDGSQVFSRFLTRNRKNYYSFAIDLSGDVQVFPCFNCELWILEQKLVKILLIYAVINVERKLKLSTNQSLSLSLQISENWWKFKALKNGRKLRRRS